MSAKSISDDKIITIIKRDVMNNDAVASLEKTLWRMAGGSRSAAFRLVREMVTHYGLTKSQVEDFHIDCALGELNGGVEVEWETE